MAMAILISPGQETVLPNSLEGIRKSAVFGRHSLGNEALQSLLDLFMRGAARGINYSSRDSGHGAASARRPKRLALHL